MVYNTFLISITVSLLAFTYGQEMDEKLKCPGGYCIAKHLCPNDTYTDDPKLVPTIEIEFGVNDTHECGHFLLKCCKSVPNTTTVDSDEIVEPPASNVECGQFNENGLFYKVKHNDSLAQYAQYPWVVYIITQEKKQSSETDSTFVCGGTLINTRLVVTTAHNTDGKSNLIARFGEWDISTTSEPFPQQEISVEKIIKHPEYVYNPIQNDIALLYLKAAVLYDHHIKPICLPQPNDQFVGKRCISNGWGKQIGAYANVMKKIMLPVIEQKTCARMLRSAGLWPFYTLKQGFICAGGEAGVDMCIGDGGSPLACQTDSGIFVLAGIVSWGIGCGGYNLPGVYVAVNRYVDWIRSFIVDSSIDFEVVF